MRIKPLYFMFIINDFFLFNWLSVITDTLNYHFLEHTHNRVEEGIGGGRVILQFYGISKLKH